MAKALLFLFLALSAATEAARILAFFPMPGKSHQFLFRSIIEELAKRGHEVTFVTSLGYDKVPSGITQILVQEPALTKTTFSYVDHGEATVPAITIKMHEICIDMGSSLLAEPKIQSLIHSNEKFDAVLMESYFKQMFFTPLIHKFGAVGVEVMGLGDCAWVNEYAGLPDNPAYQLDYKNEHTNEFNFFERLYNFYVTSVTVAFSYYYLYKHQAVADTYFNYTGWENRPPLYRMISNRSVILTNSHFAVGYPFPTAPHKKEIGGVHIKPPKPLPKDLQSYMDQSKNGVIYMSLGTHLKVSDVANDKIRDSFMNVFKDLPYNVLLKWEKEYPGKLPPNVKISTWIPQQDVLAHKNCVLFITHGGYLSISEAVHFGVPLVGIPFFGDQAKNLVIVEEAGYGRMLRHRNITKETVEWTLKEVLFNKRYKEEVMRRSKMFRDRIRSPAEEAAYWVEHAIKYPNALTPKAAWLTFVQLHLIDVQVFILAVLGALLYIVCKLVCVFGSLFRSKPKEKPEGKKKLKKN